MKRDGPRGFRALPARFLYMLLGLALCAAACSQHQDAGFFGYWDEVCPASALPSDPIEQFVFHPDGAMVHNVVIDTSVTSSMGHWEARRQADSSWQLTLQATADGGSSASTYRLAFHGPDRFELNSDAGGPTRVFEKTVPDTVIGVAIDSTRDPVPVVTLWARPGYAQEFAAHLRGATQAQAETVQGLLARAERSWQQARQQLMWGRRFRREGALRLQAADSARALGDTVLADSVAKLAEINTFQQNYHLTQSYMYEAVAERQLKRCDLEVPGTRAVVRAARPLAKDTTRSDG